ncbi:hypothetical protein BO71DRAFT_174587 [Aspergillus ellipticus CBS 707.79]|uniref:Ig-like domain-containing protein n=1 Tax=Aspergillus ellipticus CBS 707.79 TaxID=1448320 RepID=A0A319EXR4_9EURO|nr:hypothetical protein BO71DRAFT_174587 [Aspergillus ellipticus CBS 707.79]
MKSFTTILLGAFLSGTALAGSPSRTLANHTIVEMTYSGPITPGGQHIEFTGHSIQDIHSQILALNPDFKLNDPAASTTPATSKRSKEDSSIICDIPGRLSETATTDWIRSGISYLKGLDGNCGVTAGPAACARISCSYDSGIYLCNDNKKRLNVKCSKLAAYAEDIIEKCDGGEYVNGQEFDTDNFNIVVAGDVC